MNRVFIWVLLLSIAGSVVGGVFLTVQKCIYQYTSANFVIMLFKFSILFFVVPFFYILEIFDNSTHVFSEYDMVILTQEGTLERTIYDIRKITHFADIISVLWAIGIVIYLSIQLITYFWVVSSIKRKCIKMQDVVWNEEFYKICKSKNLEDKKIILMTCSALNQPCTVGILNKTVLIPDYLIDSLNILEINIVLNHELMHITRNDILLKISIVILGSLNWFNPMIWVLRNNLFDWIEIGCDENLVAASDDAYRSLYVNTLIKVNEEQCRYCQNKIITCFNSESNLEYLKRRIKGIMKEKKSAGLFVKTTVFLGILCVAVGGTALAKEADMPVHAMFSDHIAIMDEDNYSCEYAKDKDLYSEEDSFVDFDDINLEKSSELQDSERENISYKIIFIDGSAQEVAEDVFIEVKHIHNYKKVNIREHVKHEDGSCTITIREGKKCTKCNYVFRGNIISETTYKTCIH